MVQIKLGHKTSAVSVLKFIQVEIKACQLTFSIMELSANVRGVVGDMVTDLISLSINLNLSIFFLTNFPENK